MSFSDFEPAINADASANYFGSRLLQIAMPLGGIGSGNVCLNGQGGLQDFSLRHLPATTAVPDGHSQTDAAFALLHIKGSNPITKLVEGPMPVERIYDQGLQAQGYRKGGHEGLPRFSDCEFRAQYPFGEVLLRDPSVPLSVTVVGWSPFVPGDDIVSSLPAAFLEYSFENTSGETVDFEFSYHLSHLALGASGWKGTRNAVMPEGGVLFSNIDDTALDTYGTAAPRDSRIRAACESALVPRRLVRQSVSAVARGEYRRVPGKRGPQC